MLLQDVNPYIRFAQRIVYHSNRGMVYASDVHIFYILSGTATFRIRDTVYSAGADSFFLIPPGVPYHIAVVDTLQMDILNFDYCRTRSDISSYIPLRPVVPGEEPCVETEEVEDCPVLNGPIYLQQGSFLLNTIHEIFDVCQAREVYYQESASCYLKQMLISIAKASAFSGSKSNRTAQKLIDFVKEHYSENLTIEQIAGQFSYNPYHMNRMMRKATGTTVHKYLIQYRITAAKQLLAESDLSVEEIARAVGFSDTSYFSNSFKKAVGCRPSDFRVLMHHDLC